MVPGAVVQEWKKRDGRGGMPQDAVQLQMDEGAVTLVVDLAKAFATVQVKEVRVLAMHFGVTQRTPRVSCWYFEHQRRVLFEECVAFPLQDATGESAIFLGSTLDCDAGCDGRSTQSVPTV